MRARELREQASELYAAGKLERTRRVLSEAQHWCAEESTTSWELEVETLHALGLDAEAVAVAREIASSSAASRDDRDRAAAWVAEVPQAGSASAEELLAAGLAKQAQGDRVAAQRAFDRALVELERTAGTPAVFEPRRAIWDVSAMTWAPDGGTLAVAEGSLIHLLATDNYREVLRIVTGMSRILGIAISPDGHMLAASALAGAVTLWDLHSGTQVGTVGDESGGLRTLVFSPDGQLLAGRRWEDALAPVWQVSSRVLLRTLGAARGRTALGGTRASSTDPGFWPEMLAFSPDGARVLGALDRSLALWDLSLAAPSGARALEGERANPGQGMFYSVAYDPKGARAASATDTGRIVLWNLASGAPLASAQAHGLPSILQFSRDGQRLLSVSLDGTVRTFVAHSLSPVDSYRTPIALAEATAAQPDARAAALVGGGFLVVQDVVSRQLTRVLAPGLPLSALAVRGDVSQLALGTTAGAVGLLRVASAETQWLEGHESEISSLAFSPDGSELASAARDKTARVWDVRTGAVRYLLQHSAAVNALAYRGDGRVLATGGEDGLVHVWDAASGKQIKTLEGSSCAILALRFSPDGARLVANTADHLVLRWDAPSYSKQPATSRGYACSGELSPSRHGLALTRDGQIIASAPGGGAVELWSASTGELQGTLGDASQLPFVSSVAISPRDPLVVAVAQGRVHAWRLPQKAEIVVPEAAVSVEALEFSADGRLLFGFTQRGSVSVWKVAPGAADVRFELGLELSSESSASLVSAEGLTERLGSPPPPAACVVGKRVYPAELCEERYATTGLLARTLLGGSARK